MKGVRRGDHNVVELYCGCVGSGKTTAALARMGDYAYCHRFAHDPNMGLRRKLPDGKPTGVIRHESIDSIRSAISRGDPGGIHAYQGSTMEPTHVLTLAYTVAALQLRRDPKDEDEEIGPPSMVLIDEIAAWDQAQARRPFPGPDVVQLVGRRRPLHTGVIFTAQRPSMVHRWLCTEATRIVLFRLHDPADVERLVEGNWPRSEVEKSLSFPWWTDKTGEGKKRIEAGEQNFVVLERV
jgi:hypothetical protein